MARRSQWDDNPEIWEHAARLRAGGLTYSEIRGRLAVKDKSRLGLEVIPTEDVIRYNLKKRSLIGKTASTLPPDELEEHYRALTYMGNVLKGKIQSPMDKGAIPLGWEGFEIGKIGWPDPRTEAEEEVSQEWDETSSGPEAFSQYDYFHRHMNATLLGRKVINLLAALKRTAAGYKEERIKLRNVVATAINKALPETDDTQREDLIGTLFSRINPRPTQKTTRPRRVPGPTRKRSPTEARTAEKVAEVLEQLRSSDANAELKKQLRKLSIAQSYLSDALSPKTKVRRMIQDSECELCSAKPLERAE
ncbi:hypothetical protein [Candidatus Lucifugimonas marina]|uniref:Uncharacterized protein n=1 Tax=Candidatus Lucifugimonas marina TaxID=3038979 RepID=A0AAJ6CVN4_9CHLR|nr:hypothetical protein [SAR202 cluster bacterium JH702]MDG0870014.1 hypothetical protein [SAR202 cluster bacterium JH639]WFG36421.1 hypothetical protein GKN94_12245 [SAR202 cluster bacterium JH545]WFG40354.1 hypothetical protein GKO48_12280 [SAR202 cluster bacterium JH1073]